MYNWEQMRVVMKSTINKICQQRNISKNQLAKLSGMSVSTISDLMNDKTMPDLYTVLNICKTLNVTMCDLFALKDECWYMNGQRKNDMMIMEERQLSEKWKQLSDEHRRLVLLYMDMILNYQKNK